MSSAAPANAEQIARWNGASADAWIEAQALLDHMFEPFTELLIEGARGASPGSVLDVGCGTGSTTLAVARVLGPQGRAIGVDISEPMLALARTRAPRVRERSGEEGTVPSATTSIFLHADAQTHRFEPESFDVIISRFGVMFFDDSVAAFANLRHAARAGARLRCVVWRGAAENPFMTAAERAAAPLLPNFLPNLPARQPDAPGQFAFAHESRIRRILQDSGWTEPSIRPIDISCAFPAQGLNLYMTRFGPLGQVLPQLDEQTRQQIVPRVHAAFEPYIDGAEVRFTAACWLVDAVKPAL
jgi:SAM-dependent methyltransferase